MSIGFIKLHRKIIEWEWYSDVNVCRVFLHLLLTANFENKKWQGIDISRGQVITSLEKLGKSTTLTIQQVRTALNKLKSTHEITIKATKLHTFITLTNYNLYQDRIIESNTPDNTPDNNSSTNDQQRINKGATTTKEGKELKEREEVNNLKSQFEEIYRLYNQGKNLKVIPFDKQKAKFQNCLKKISFDELKQNIEDYLKYLSTATWRQKKSFDAWINSSEFFANDWKSEGALSGNDNLTLSSLIVKLNSIAGKQLFTKTEISYDDVVLKCESSALAKEARELSQDIKDEIKKEVLIAHPGKNLRVSY
jgi:hypothetical protein